MLTEDAVRVRPNQRARFSDCFMTALLASVFTISLTATGHAESKSEMIVFDIPAQAVPDALNEWARQANVELLFVERGFEGVRSTAVVGSYSPLNALEHLLAGTGLEARYQPGATVTVSRADNPFTQPIASTNSVSAHTLRLAQANAADSSRVSGSHGDSADDGMSTAPAATANTESPKELGRITVTGTQIRGPGPVGANVITITRDDIERTGLATTHEVIQTIPQNYGGGSNEDTIISADGTTASNFSFGSGINLRGLDNDSTLVLLDGRRISPASSDGDFIDVSAIPLTAVERIEVLPDGASAIYGSDAIGGVVNVILRKEYDGAEVRLRVGPDVGADLSETQLGVVLGKSWSSGQALVTYEYYRRDALAASRRAYTATSNLTELGGDDFRDPNSNPANITNFTTNFAIPPNQDGTALSPDDLLEGQVNLVNTQEGVDTLPEQEQHSVYIRGTQDIGDRFELFGQAQFSRREFEAAFPAADQFLIVPSSNPFFVDPFGGSSRLFVRYSFIDDLGPILNDGEQDSLNGAAGVNFDISDSSWRADIYGSYSRTEATRTSRNLPHRPSLDDALADPDPTTAFNPFGDGSHSNPETVSAIRRGFIDLGSDTELWALHFKADGNVLNLPGGFAKIALGAEYREESFVVDLTRFTRTPAPDFEVFNDSDREVAAIFGEIYVPLIGSGISRRGLRRLELSVAARFEEYSDFGSSTDPRFGILWSPIQSLVARGTIGTSFKAPLLEQLDDRANGIFLDSLPDPASQTGTSTVLILGGNNSALSAEEATTWTAGLGIHPAAVPAFRFGFTYFETEIDGRIDRPSPSPLDFLPNPQIFASLITRDPDVELVTELLNSPNFRSAPVPPENVDAIIDFRLNNVATTNLRGVDAEFSYAHDTNFGTVNFGFHTSFLIDFKEAFIEGAPEREEVDTILRPSDFRLRGNIGWAYGALVANAFVNYTDAYTDDISDPEREVGSWTTFDLTLRYAPDASQQRDILENFALSLNVRNLFDRDPPFANINRGIGYDALNSDPWGRFISVTATKSW